MDFQGVSTTTGVSGPIGVKAQSASFGLTNHSGTQGDGGEHRGMVESSLSAYRQNAATLARADDLYCQNHALVFPTRSSSIDNVSPQISDIECRRREFQRVAAEAAALAKAGGVNGVMELNDRIAVDVIRSLEIVFD